jgi:hypothetical protein
VTPATKIDRGGRSVSREAQRRPPPHSSR